MPWNKISNISGPQGTPGIDGMPNGTTAQYWRGDKTWQTLNSSAVGLSKVTNTSDSEKPVSTAQKAALDLKVNTDPVQDWVQSTLATAVTSPFRIMFLGDSHTNDGSYERSPNGAEVWGGQTGYSNRLANLLSKNGIRQAQAGVSVSTISTPGVHLWSAAVAGQTSGGYVPAGVLANVQTISPHLVFHMIGTNDDVQQIPPSTYKTNLKAAINGVWSKVPNARQVLIVTWPRQAVGATYKWEDYAQAQREVFADFRSNSKFSIIDYSAKFTRSGGGVLTPWNGAFPDGVHASRALHRDLTELICEWMGLPSPMTTYGSQLFLGSSPFRDGTDMIDPLNPISKVTIPAAPVPRSVIASAGILVESVAGSGEPELYLRPLIPGTTNIIPGMSEKAFHYGIFSPWQNKDVKAAWEILPPHTPMTVALNSFALRVYGGAGYNVYNQMWVELKYV